MDIRFLGAAQEVTGSCFLVEAGDSRVLVDCGLIQGRPDDEARNRDPLPFDHEHIDAVVLSHAHLDHSGRLPLLTAAGYKGPIYAHPATRDLCRIMLKDAGYLNEKDAEWENKKRRRRGEALIEPLYTQRDAAQAVRRFHAVRYGQTRRLTPDIRIRMRDAGHILGSCIVEMWAAEQGKECKLVFSGDLGHYGAPILHDPEAIGEADQIVMESTYGDRCHRSWESTWEELGQVITDAHHRRGNILIPAFTVGRTQELLYAFGQNYDQWELDRWNIFLDSPMGIEATEVYRRHSQVYDAEASAAHGRQGDLFELPNLHFTRTTKQSMGINQIRSGAIVIAGSGMCTGGRIKHHLKHNLWRENCHVLFVGFQAAGTLGRRLVDGADEVALWGEPIRVAAQVHTIGGFSAHADRDGLARWYGEFSGAPPVALVHGEPRAIEGLAEKLRSEHNAPVTVPVRGQKLQLAMAAQGRASSLEE